MALSDVGGNVRRYMKINGYSIPELAEKSSMGKATLSNLLNGKGSPNSSTLLKIADALHVSLPDLIADTQKLTTVRFRTHKMLTARELAEKDQLLIDAREWLTNYQFLETELDKPTEYKFENKSFSSPEEAATAVRAEFQLKANEPVYDIVRYVTNCGIKIGLHRFGLSKTFGISIGKNDGGPAIVVNSDDKISMERKRFTVAHELGHLLLHTDSFDGICATENQNEEKEANSFAAELLMPQEAFLSKLAEYSGISWIDAVLYIKQYFGVSYKTVLYRLSNKLSDETMYQKFNTLYNAKYHHDLKDNYEPNPLDDRNLTPAKDEPEHIHCLPFEDERFAGLVRQAYEAEKISISRAAEMLGISAEEMRERISSWLK